jgi:hypothetical protein
MLQLFIDLENLNLRLYDELLIFQISIPMSVEFEELAKLRDNPSDEQASKYFYFYCCPVVYYPKLLIPLLWCGYLTPTAINCCYALGF